MIESKSYFTTIPGYIRKDKRLTPNCKMLFGDIAALCEANGQCWASNAYFAKIFDVDRKTISAWISKLQECGHIATEVQKDENGEIANRFIKIGIPIPFIPVSGIHKNMEEIKTEENITSDMPKAKTVWETTKSDLQRFMNYYIKQNLPAMYEEADREKVGGFYGQYSKMFGAMLKTAGTVEVACKALDCAAKYYKKLGYPWGLKALNLNWCEFVNAAIDELKRRLI